MKDLLINTLAVLNYPILLQGSLSENEKYPDSFFTFWNPDSYDWDHYDNLPIGSIWEFNLNFYSVNPILVNTKLLEGVELLKNQGFIASGDGYDIASDYPTHTGRGINILIIKKK